MSDFFKFEDENADFPFYNENPKLKSKDWTALLLGVLVELSLIFGLIYFIPGTEYIPYTIFPVLYFLVLIIPVAYVCKGKLGLLFKTPKLNDIKVIIICYILYSIFTIAMGVALNYLGVNIAANSAEIANQINAISIILMFIQLLGEELFKFIIFIMTMTLTFKYTQKRKTSVIAGIAVCCIIFGLIHIGSYNWNLIQCLAVIGLGTVITTYPYYKTKNITNSYILHLMIDLIPTFLMIIGLM